MRSSFPTSLFSFPVKKGRKRPTFSILSSILLSLSLCSSVVDKSAFEKRNFKERKVWKKRERGRRIGLINGIFPKWPMRD